MKPSLAALGLVILMMGAFGPAEVAAGPAVCADSDGIWNIPNGLILGGPEDNSFQPIYADWLAACEFIAEPRLEVFEKPFAEMVTIWESCAAAFAREESKRSAESAQANPLLAELGLEEAFLPSVDEPVFGEVQSLLPSSQFGVGGHSTETLLARVVEPVRDLEQQTNSAESPVEPVLEPIEEEANRTAESAEVVAACGNPPDPDQMLDNGNLRFEIPMMHVGTEHGSIQYGSWTTMSDGTTKKLSINIVFWYVGEAQHTYNKMTGPGHWEDAGCGDERYAWIDDRAHGGLNKLWNDGPNSRAHLSGYCSTGERFHIRHFGTGLRDTHSPGFGYYSTANVHWENHYWDGWGWQTHGDTARNGPGEQHLLAEYTQWALSWSKVYDPYVGYQYYFKINW